MTHSKINLLRKLIKGNLYIAAEEEISEMNLDVIKYDNLIFLLEQPEVTNNDINFFLSLNKEKSERYSNIISFLKNVYPDLIIIRLLEYNFDSFDQYQSIGRAIRDKIDENIIDLLVQKAACGYCMDKVMELEQKGHLNISFEQLDFITDEKYISIFNDSNLGSVLFILEKFEASDIIEKKIFIEAVEDVPNEILKDDRDPKCYINTLSLRITYNKLKEKSEAQQCIKDYVAIKKQELEQKDQKSNQKVIAFPKKVV